MSFGQSWKTVDATKTNEQNLPHFLRITEKRLSTMVMLQSSTGQIQKKIRRLIVSKGSCARTKDAKVHFKQKLNRRQAAKKEKRTIAQN